jgi:hypothetical protein
VNSRPAGRLPVPRDPFRLLVSAAPWRACAYLASYLVVGSVLFVVTTAAVLAGVVLSQLTLGLPLVVGTAWIVRGCAQLERGRATLVDRPIPYRYQEVTEPGLAAHIRTRCTDPAALRDCAYLVLLFPALLLLDTVALLAWLLPLAGVTLPLWYWAVNMTEPDGTSGHGIKFGYQHSPGSDLGFRVDNLPAALAVALLSLALGLLTARLAVLAAQLHLAVARSVLRPPGDPLAQVKRMLAEPGPLVDWRTSPSADTPLSELSDKEAHEPGNDQAC